MREPASPVQRRPGWRRIAGRLAGSTLLAGALALPGNAQALIIVSQPWVKPGVHATEAYMDLTSTEGALLIGVRSPIAEQASLRGPGAKVGARAALALPAGVKVSLRPGASRVFLSGLSRVLKSGERVPLNLLVQTEAGTSQEIAVDAEVRSESPFDAEAKAHRH